MPAVLLNLCAALLCSLTCCATVVSIHPSIDFQLVVVDFLLGTLATDVCPATSVAVDTEAECRLAASTRLGPYSQLSTYVGVVNDASKLNGCVWDYRMAQMYFNMHWNWGNGILKPYETPVCADVGRAVAGGYFLGKQGINGCPRGPNWQFSASGLESGAFGAGWKIENDHNLKSFGAEDCSTAASALGYEFAASVVDPEWPQGCIVRTLQHAGTDGYGWYAGAMRGSTSKNAVFFNKLNWGAELGGKHGKWSDGRANNFKTVCYGARSGPRPFVYVRVSVHAACMYRCTSGIPPS